MLRESGIYDRLVMIGLNPSRVGPDRGQTQHKSEQEFETLTVKQMKGLFILHLLFCFLSLFVIIIEIYMIIC